MGERGRVWKATGNCKNFIGQGESRRTTDVIAYRRAILGRAIYWNVLRRGWGRLLRDGGLAEQAMDDVPNGGGNSCINILLILTTNGSR